MGHRVQLLLYGWLLQESRFKLSDALLVSVLVPTANAALLAEIDDTARQQLARTLHLHARAIADDSPERKNWYASKVPLTDGFWVRLRIFRYERRVARRELEFFAQYWAGEREAIPSHRPRKCGVCLYNASGACKVPASPYAGGA